MLSLHVPSRHVALYDPGEFIGCKYPVLGRQHWPSPSLNRLGTPKYPTIRFRWVLVFRGFTGSHRYDLSSGSPPWRIRPGISRPTEAFTPRLPSDWLSSSTPGITTAVTRQYPPAGLSRAGTAASIAALSDTRCGTWNWNFARDPVNRRVASSNPARGAKPVSFQLLRIIFPVALKGSGDHAGLRAAIRH